MVRRAWARPMPVLLATGLCLAACSNGGKPSSSSTTTTAPPISTDTIVPNNVPNQVGVRKDVQLLNCAQSSGGWSAGGTVNNTLGKAAIYTITVFFTSSQATDLAYAITMVRVDNGKNSLWTTKATFAAPPGVICVLRGVAAR